MSTDDDIAAALPKPPPPAPARREAAIGEALRRFDAGGEASPTSAGPERAKPKPRWWTALGRPQTGVLVSAALVALIGLPVAWVSLTPQTEIGNGNHSASPAPAPDVRRPTAMADANTPPPPPPALRAESRMPPPGFIPDKIAPGVAPPPPSPPPPAMAPPPPPPAAIVMERVESSRDSRAAEPVDLAKASNRATPVMSARAPSPAETPYALRDVDDSSIIVTGSRRSRVRRVERGDWNACTVNDPRQRLAACKRIVDPAARGVAGVVAARIADGLTQAWQGNNAEAIDKFDQAIATDPRSAFAHLNRGLAHANRGDLDRAIADLDQAVRYAPRDARGYYNRSVLLRQRGDIRRARVDEGRAVDLDPSYSDVVR
jgi:hypothetical protein